MMATSNEQQVTLAASTEAHLMWPVYYDNILIENLGSAPVWVATDGTAATVNGADLDVVEANSAALVANRQPKQPAVTTAAGSTAQKITVPASGFLTYVSLISTGTPQVVVSPQ